MAAHPRPHPATLWVDRRPVAPVLVATSWWARTRGLIARPPPIGALWLPATTSVHTMAMGYPIEVACCDRHGVVRTVHHLDPWRMILPRPAVRIVVEAASGAFACWGVVPGSRLAVVHQD